MIAADRISGFLLVALVVTFTTPLVWSQYQLDTLGFEPSLGNRISGFDADNDGVQDYLIANEPFPPDILIFQSTRCRLTPDVIPMIDPFYEVAILSSTTIAVITPSSFTFSVAPRDVFIFSIGPSFSTTPVGMFSTPAVDDFFTFQAISDRDGDGQRDLVIHGAEEGSLGRVIVLSSQTGQVLFDVQHGTSSTLFGSSLAEVSDLNNDGVRELAAGEPFNLAAGMGNGQVRMLNGLTGAILFNIPSPLTSGNDFEFSHSLAAMSDVNNDGRMDLAIGSGGSRAYIVSGANGAVLHSLSVLANPFPATTYVVSINDQNGDGPGDLAVFSNRIEVFSGNNGQIISDATATPFFPGPPANIGDVSGDGRDDLLMDQEIFGVRRYRGTEEDFFLLVNTSSCTVQERGLAFAGDLVFLDMFSGFFTFFFGTPLLAAQVHFTGSSLPGLANFPEVHLHPAFNPPPVLILDGTSGPFGPAILGNGISLAFQVIPGLAGATARIQAFVISNSAANGIFAASHGFDLEFR